MSEKEQIEAQAGDELDETQLEAVSGGDGIISDAIDWCAEQINKAGQQLVQAASGGMIQQ
ncbi:MAG TPA: hypothetical protein VF746_03530 [Longimicrobium sp.]|jgi:hypothetical protein